MGAFYIQTWKCESCNFEIELSKGVYEAHPSDFGTTHCIAPYHCPICNSVKNVANCVGFKKPKPENKYLIRHDSDICEHCKTKMERLEKETKYNCPECGKKQFQFISEEMWRT